MPFQLLSLLFELKVKTRVPQIEADIAGGWQTR